MDDSKKVGERTTKRTVTVTFTSDEVARILRREAGAPKDAGSVHADGSQIYGEYEVEWTETESDHA